jgi:hypothetical protein
METESEFADVYLDTIRKYAIPSALLRDNAISEMIQRFKDIHRDLMNDDQCTELHSPWQNPAELNCVKYLKTNNQILLDSSKVYWYAYAMYTILHCLLNLIGNFRAKK